MVKLPFDPSIKPSAESPTKESSEKVILNNFYK